MVIHRLFPAQDQELVLLYSMDKYGKINNLDDILDKPLSIIRDKCRPAKSFSARINNLLTTSQSVKNFFITKIESFKDRYSIRYLNGRPLSLIDEDHTLSSSNLNKMTGHGIEVTLDYGTTNERVVEIHFNNIDLRTRKSNVYKDWVSDGLVKVFDMRDSFGAPITSINDAINSERDDVVKKTLELLTSPQFLTEYAAAKNNENFGTGHEFIVNYVKKHSPYSIVSESMAWAFSPDGTMAITGHPDLLQMNGMTTYINDAKPNEHSDANNPQLTRHIFGSIPQIISYCLMMKQMMEREGITGREALNFKCIIYNYESMIVFNPTTMLNAIYEFYAKTIIELAGDNHVSGLYVWSELMKIDLFRFFPPSFDDIDGWVEKYNT